MFEEGTVTTHRPPGAEGGRVGSQLRNGVAVWSEMPRKCWKKETGGNALTLFLSFLPTSANASQWPSQGQMAKMSGEAAID